MNMNSQNSIIGSQIGLFVRVTMKNEVAIFNVHTTQMCSSAYKSEASIFFWQSIYVSGFRSNVKKLYVYYKQYC